MQNTPIHQHKRKRLHKLNEPYPHPKPWLEKLDHLVIIVAIISPLTALPQIYNIWYLQNVEGVSLLTWLLFSIIAIPLLIYGIAHKEKVLIILNSLWLIMYAAVISGVLYYG